MAKGDTKTINRQKRTSFERKCISKSAKRMFMGMGKQVFKLILEAEGRNKKSAKQKSNKE